MKEKYSVTAEACSNLVKTRLLLPDQLMPTHSAQPKLRSLSNSVGLWIQNSTVAWKISYCVKGEQEP